MRNCDFLIKVADFWAKTKQNEELSQENQEKKNEVIIEEETVEKPKDK